MVFNGAIKLIFQVAQKAQGSSFKFVVVWVFLTQLEAEKIFQTLCNLTHEGNAIRLLIFERFAVFGNAVKYPGFSVEPNIIGVHIGQYLMANIDLSIIDKVDDFQRPSRH